MSNDNAQGKNVDPKLSSDEARNLMKAIEAVEKEEAAELEKLPSK